MIPEFQDPDRRETFVFKYRLMYRVEPDCIRILRVVHGQRLRSNVPGSFQEPPQAPYGPAAAPLLTERPSDVAAVRSAVSSSEAQT